MTIICDFCSKERVRWDYPADDFEIEIEGYGPTGHASREGWAACDVCHALIEAGDRDGLARRAATSFEAQFGVFPGDTRARVHREMRKLHDQFFAHRTGPGEAMGVA